MEKNMNMEMVRYKVLETGFRVGYIEFVDNLIKILLRIDSSWSLGC